MNVRLLIIIIALTVTSLLGIFYFSSRKTPPETTAPPATETPKATETKKPEQSPTPTSTSISKPVPVTTRTLRGTVTAVSDASISINSQGKVENFSLEGVNDIFRLTGGSLEGGDAKTAQAPLKDIKIGQEVLVIADKDSPAVQRLVIIK